MAFALTAGVALLACVDGGAGDPEQADAAAVDAEAAAFSSGAVFRTLEQRLLQAETVALDFEVVATGALDAELEGRLEMASGGGVELTATGMFAGDAVEVGLRTENDTYVFGNPPGGSTATPAQLREALLIGLTRMGIFHTLARLTADEPPDHAEGGVGDWAVVDDFAADPNVFRTLTFSIAVAGEPVGNGSLQIRADGVPVVRHQTVLFAGGVMHVVERYSNIVITP